MMLPLQMPARNCDERTTPATLTYDAIKYLRAKKHEVCRVSDSQHRVRCPGEKKVKLLSTNELKAYAARLGWRAGERV